MSARQWERIATPSCGMVRNDGGESEHGAGIAGLCGHRLLRPIIHRTRRGDLRLPAFSLIRHGLRRATFPGGEGHVRREQAPALR